MSIENFPELKTERESIQENCTLEIYDAKKTPWDEIKDDIMRIEISSSGEKPGLDEEILKEAFEDPASIIIITKDVGKNKIVGFSLAGPAAIAYLEDYPERPANDDTAYIWDSALEKGYQGHGLIAPVNEEMEQQLTERGFSFMERDVANEKKDKDSTTEETYADKIRKNYKGRIIKEEAHDSEYGPQVFFRIKLKKPDENPKESLSKKS